jgi:Na+(H+)/acetate symporter ActP
MQFLILLIGALVFTFYQFNPSPVFFNKVEVDRIETSANKTSYKQLEKDYQLAHAEKRTHVDELVTALHTNDEKAVDEARIKLQEADAKSTTIRKKVTALMKKNDALADTNDTNYIFLIFVTEQLPVGIVGLLIAIIFLAAMGSTASGLNSLASTTIVDFYQRIFKKQENDKKYLSASRWATVAWGVFCIIVAFYASRLGNLIEAVNILGSLFYGTILGIFLVAFYMKNISGTAVFYAAIIAEAFIVYAWVTNLTAFLWLNVIGCLLVMIFAYLIQLFCKKKGTEADTTLLN